MAIYAFSWGWLVFQIATAFLSPLHAALVGVATGVWLYDIGKKMLE